MSYPHKIILDHYTAAIQKVRGLELKGKTMPYTSVNGHMCSFLDKEGQMSLRLSEEEREIFMTDYDSELSMQHGRLMKEYVVVPEKVFSDEKKLVGYLEKCLNYTSSLKPKVSKKKE